MIKVITMKKKLFITLILIVFAVALSCSTCFAAEETNVKPVDNMGDILFYILAAVLVVAVIAICIIFRYSKKFVIKERARLIEQKKEYIPAKEVRVCDKNPENSDKTKEKN